MRAARRLLDVSSRLDIGVATGKTLRDGKHSGIATGHSLEGIRLGLSRLRRSHAGAMACPNPWPTGRQSLAVISPAARSLPPGGPTGTRAANLVEAVGDSPGGVPGITLLPSANSAFADP